MQAGFTWSKVGSKRDNSMRLTFSHIYALITGGSSDLGIALAQALLNEGVSPILTYRSDAGKEIIEQALHKITGSYRTVYMDLAIPSSVTALVSSLEHSIYYVIDLAQGHSEGLFASLPDTEIEAYIQENITSRALLLKQLTRDMLAQQGGRLLFVSSTAAQLPNKGQGLYSASKLASEALYKQVGIELAAKNITTLSLRFGYIDSGRGKSYLDSHSNILKQIPSGQALTLEETVNHILFYLSDNTHTINATEIVIDGGLTACKKETAP